MENSSALITQLPESLVILIISFLPFIDAVRFCSLSRQWFRLWVHSKIIEFDENHFIESETLNQLMDVGLYNRASEIEMRERMRFIEYIRMTLPLFTQGDFSKFRLRLAYQPDYDHYIEEWVRLAIARNVKELNLDFSDAEPLAIFRAVFEPHYIVPTFLYEDKSLRVLSLTFCDLKSFNFQSFIALNSLYLGQIFITATLVQKLLTNCPLLEELSLVDSSIQEKLKISSPCLRLKRLVIRGCMPLSRGIELFAPKLQYFEYLGYIAVFQLDYLEDLVDVVLDFGLQTKFGPHSAALCDLLRGLNKAKALTLCTYLLKVLPSKDVVFYELPSPLVNLVHLTLNTGLEECELLGILCLLRSSPNLETLVIRTGVIKFIDGFTYSQFSVMPERCWVPPKSPFRCLKTIIVEGFIGSKYEMDLLKFLLRNAMVLQKVIIIPPQVLTIARDEVLSMISWQVEELENLKRASRCAQIVYQQSMS